MTNLKEFREARLSARDAGRDQFTIGGKTFDRGYAWEHYIEPLLGVGEYNASLEVKATVELDFNPPKELLASMDCIYRKEYTGVFLNHYRFSCSLLEFELRKQNRYLSSKDPHASCECKDLGRNEKRCPSYKGG